jgi:enediyne biosynthesis protein E4
VATSFVTAMVVSGVATDVRQGAHPWRGEAEPALQFRDATTHLGLPPEHVTTWGTAVASLQEREGPLILLNRHTRAPTLFEKSGDVFRPMDIDWRMPMDRHTCSWGEADGNGDPDLFCPQGARGGTGSGANELWLSAAPGFVEAAEAWGIDYPMARARTAAWLDYDRDGRLDLLVGAVHREGAPDQLFRNDGERFRPAESAINGERQTVAVATGDVTGDGWTDVLLLQSGGSPILYVNDHGEYRRAGLRGIPAHPWRSGAFADFDGDGLLDLHLVAHGRSAILRNVGGNFVLVDDRAIRRGRSSAWLDIDNDMLLDLYVVASAQGPGPDGQSDATDFVLHQQPDGHFRRVALEMTANWPGSGDGVAVLDADGDGRSDVLVANGHARWSGPTVLLRNTTPGGNSASIQIVGPAGNPFGFGTQLKVETPSHTYRRQVTTRLSGYSQSEVGREVLALGGQFTADVTIDWPDGSQSCVVVTAGDVVTAEHDRNPC